MRVFSSGQDCWHINIFCFSVHYMYIRLTEMVCCFPEMLVRSSVQCDHFKNFYHIYTDGSKMGHRVSAALCHKRGTSAIQLPGATSIFNAELHAILLALDVVRRSKEKYFLLLSDSYSSVIALGGSHVDQNTIYKYLKTYSTLTNSGKTVILCWIPVTWGSLETRELIG